MSAPNHWRNHGILRPVKSFKTVFFSLFETGFCTRRFGPYESAYLSRFKNRHLGRFYGIRGKNRLKRFQIENDPQKGGTIPAICVVRGPFPIIVTARKERAGALDRFIL